MNDLGFLAQENSLPELTALSMSFSRLSTGSSPFASLAHAPNLRVLEVNIDKSEFNNECLKYLENMAHLRKLDLSYSTIAVDSESFQTLIQNLSQLEELNLSLCDIGKQGAIAGALYSTRSRLRVLNLGDCNLVDDDLNGIGALKNALEELDLSRNSELTNETLVQCKDLVKLKKLKLYCCFGIDDVSPFRDCSNLEELDVSCCGYLSDNSFKVFSDERNSFTNLRVLDLCGCQKLSEKVLEHLAQNKYLVFQLKELNVRGMSEIVVSSSATARNNICRLKGLRSLHGILDSISSEEDQNNLKAELMQSLKNLDEVD